MNHVISIRDLGPETSKKLLQFSQLIQKNPANYSQSLKGKSILQFLIESSTRTRTSFESATRALGATSVGFSSGTSSLSKGESLFDTVQTLNQYGVHGVVIRHSYSGSAKQVAQWMSAAVINAGDGSHEHPTQALLDAFTLAQHWGSDLSQKAPFQGKCIGIVGDISNSRVARSNLHLLSMLGARVILIGPASMIPSDLSLFPKHEVSYLLDPVINQLDAIMMLRIQFERNSGISIPSAKEYRAFWGLTLEREKKLKPHAVILHPGPINRGIEIDPEVADCKKSLILKQVSNSVAVRMAVLHYAILGFPAEIHS